MINKTRWITAMHEAAHAAAYFSFNMTPDRAELISDEEGKVHHDIIAHWKTCGLEEDHLRQQYAVISCAGIVMESICYGYDVENDLLVGDSKDLRKVMRFGFKSDFERMSIQLEALSIVESNEPFIRGVAGMLHHQGRINGEDLEALWDHNHRKYA